MTFRFREERQKMFHLFRFIYNDEQRRQKKKRKKKERDKWAELKILLSFRSPQIWTLRSVFVFVAIYFTVAQDAAADNNSSSSSSCDGLI